MSNNEHLLADRLDQAMAFEQELTKAVIGQAEAVRLLTIAVFARGHALLEGGVGVGKTTLLRAVARAIGGQYARIEGTIDLMPADLIYYTYLDEHGKPAVAPGPLLSGGTGLSTFFFNEINRARPQVHSLLLRAMAERSVTAFNREHAFPHLQVFADRNRVEKEETFELPAAARDRFMLEIAVPTPTDPDVQDRLTFDPRFHDPDRLIASVRSSILAYDQLNDIAAAVQEGVGASDALRSYVRELWRASCDPESFGVRLPDAEMGDLIESGPSPRGMSHLIRASRVRAWLHRRNHIHPEDVQAVFAPVMLHRIFLKPVYEYRRAELVPELVGRILRSVAAP
jgi:MoxR-like ATPase